MDINKIIESLHPLERGVLPALKDNISLNEITNKTNLSEVEAIRALQWLENKEIVKINKEVKEIVRLDENGEKYLIEGLPEKQLLSVLLYNKLSITEIEDRTNLNKDEVNVSLGILKKIKSIDIDTGILEITNIGRDKVHQEFKEESLLKKLPIELDKLSKDEKEILKRLRLRRNLVKVEEDKTITVNLTPLAKKLQKLDIKVDFIEKLTPELIKSGNWKKTRFRRYDVKINVPKIFYGRRHFVNDVKNNVRRIWLDLGFKEMTGTNVQSSFWNFDALFTAQDHPVRDLHDTYFLKNPDKAKLPDKKLVDNVKRTHEDGWITGSKGWRYSWDENLAKKNVLRTHTTCLSVKTLSQLKEEDLPAKFFSVGKVYRNETMDWKHLAEFYQTEGIVVGKDLNFKHLLGYLKAFFNKMGYNQIRFRPAFFPYTYVSTEIEVFHPIKKQWIELGGSGMFRPEITIPLVGKDIKVLAWGLGLERIITPYYKINDLREVYKNDLKMLRNSRPWFG